MKKLIIICIIFIIPILTVGQMITVSYKYVNKIAPIGISAKCHVLGGIGLFMDGGFKPNHRLESKFKADYPSSLKTNIVNDIYSSSYFNAGLSMTISKLGFQLGCGFVTWKNFIKYRYSDPFIDQNGNELYEKGTTLISKRNTSFNVIIGAHYNIFKERINVGVSFETAPRNFGVSIGYNFR